MAEKTFHIISLGCAKNLVDSESMAAILTNIGDYALCNSAEEARFIIVNTCGFIQIARQESIDMLQNLAGSKKDGQILIAAGCLTERYRENIVEAVPGIDGIMGCRRWMDILDFIEQFQANRPKNKTLYHLPDVPEIGKDDYNVLRAAIQGGSAYLKIADGCRRRCAFCAIPGIKGPASSRPPNQIIRDAVQLQKLGVQELILIAQDITDYGYDIGLKDGLADLLDQLSEQAAGIPWIRLLYAFPGAVSDRLINVMANQPQVLPYLDMPLQHVQPDILKSMKRPANIDWVVNTIEKMRRLMPELAIRTTFIVGYPGETESDFQALLQFMSEIKFDHLGAFTYSQEKGTLAAALGDTIPAQEKHDRLERLMSHQETISLANTQKWIGKSLPVIIEGFDNNISIGRSYRDAPEIDGLVIAEGTAPVGEIVSVEITGAMHHDLIGTIK